MLPGLAPAANSAAALASGHEALPAANAVDEKSPILVKERLDKFVDQLHEKAKTLTGWVANLEPPSNPEPSQRAEKLLGSLFFSLTIFDPELDCRFVEECKPLLMTMDECFEKLAECQFRLDTEGVSDAPLVSSGLPRRLKAEASGRYLGCQKDCTYSVTCLEIVLASTPHGISRSVKILAKQRTYTTLAAEARSRTRSGNKRKADEAEPSGHGDDEQPGDGRGEAAKPAPNAKGKAKAKGKAACKKKAKNE